MNERADVGEPNFVRVRPGEHVGRPFEHLERLFKLVLLLKHACVVKDHEGRGDTTLNDVVIGSSGVIELVATLQQINIEGPGTNIVHQVLFRLLVRNAVSHYFYC